MIIFIIATYYFFSFLTAHTLLLKSDFKEYIVLLLSLLPLVNIFIVFYYLTEINNNNDKFNFR